jgi:hypothetical protein
MHEPLPMEARYFDRSAPSGPACGSGVSVPDEGSVAGAAPPASRSSAMRARLPCRASRFSCARRWRCRSFCDLRNDGRLFPAKADSFQLPGRPGLAVRRVCTLQYAPSPVPGAAQSRLALGDRLGYLEAAPGFEPGNKGFADPRLTTWLCRHPVVNQRTPRPPAIRWLQRWASDSRRIISALTIESEMRP